MALPQEVHRWCYTSRYLEDLGASILERDVQDEFENPLPQKHLDASTIYLSRNNYGPPSIPTGIIQIADLDLSVRTKPG